MSIEVETLYQTAMKLPEQDRAELAAKLMGSIDPETEEQWSAAWEAEIAKRLEELDQGIVKAVPWAEARRIIAGEKDESRR